MYRKPTLPAGGSLCSIQACAQAIALASPHIGSVPGVDGSSGIQVNPLSPWRRVRILPSALTATTVARLATASGAADIALLIMSSADIGAGAACCCAPAPAAKVTKGRLTPRRANIFVSILASRD